MKDVLKSAIVAILVGIISLVINSYGLMLAWNYCMPLFGLPMLGYWHAMTVLLVVHFIGVSFLPTTMKVKIDD